MFTYTHAPCTYVIYVLSCEGIANVALETQFCKAAQQMLSVPSAQLCVPLASGGDPTFAFNVKLAGEEVHGTSKMWHVIVM